MSIKISVAQFNKLSEEQMPFAKAMPMNASLCGTHLPRVIDVDPVVFRLRSFRVVACGMVTERMYG